ncbi:hypothetical protein HU200_065303 [Digitaria exilis]|uniref:Uncharacterized protein n=1 Tax=Digitaria exilis TaxID=1010633 RepID=A0A835DXM5_9POAL|nr:hypothetical protein HU200_065303 [Digitaria exilis]
MSTGDDDSSEANKEDWPEMVQRQQGHWAIEDYQHLGLGWSIKGPFDESVLLWHIATDFCFYSRPRNLFTTAYDELKEILGDCEPAPFLSAPHVIHGDGELDRPAAQGGASNSKLPLLGREQQHRSIDDF